MVKNVSFRYATIEEIPEDWLKKYFEKSGDNYLSGDKLILVDNAGFFTYSYDNLENILYLYNVYGEGKALIKVIKCLKQNLKADKVIFATKRNYKAFERRWKAKLIGYVMELEI